MVERLRLDDVSKAAKGTNGRTGMMTGLVATPPRLKAMTPMGVSGVSVLSGYVRTTERNAEWVGTRKWQTIADLSVNVSIIAASVGFFLNMVAHPQWSVKPAEDVKEGKSSKEAEKLAEFVEEVINDMTTPWQRVVRRSAMYRFNGFGIQEWIAKKRDDGKIGLKDIEPRPCFTIERWAVDDDGTILGVWQRSPQTFELLGLPRGKLIYLVDDTYTDQPDGLGVYRMLAEPFNRLKQYLELEARAYERDMRGIPVGRAPVTAIKQMVKEGRMTAAEGEAQLQGIRDFITTQVRDKNTSLLIDSLPYENQTADGLTVAGTQQWDVSLLSGGVSGFAEMATAIDRLQREMARIIGTEHLMMGDQGGNRALSEDKSRNLYLIANAVLGNIADAMTHDIIDPLWSLNGFDPKLKPKFGTEDVAFKNAQEIATALAQMATAGAVLQPNDPAIDDVRDLLGIAKAPEMTPEQIGMMQGGGAGAPGAPGAAGGPFGAKKPPQPPPNGAGGANGKTPGRGSPPQLDDAKQQQVAGTTEGQSKKPGQKPVPTKKGLEKFNENHDDKGKFSSGDGSGGGAISEGSLGEGYSADAKLVDGKVYTSDVNDAVKALSEDREVVLSQPHEVATLLDKLAAIGRDAVSKGGKAPSYDLCNVSVEGTNLFCAESLGIPRINMPQLSGKPIPGSKADSMPKNAKGEVNLSEEFTKHCAGLGRVTDETVDASHLRASQNELNGGKVAGIYGAMASGKLTGGDRLFISRDDYIIDGHHRWAAAVTHEAAGTAGISTKIDVRRVDIDTVTLLDEAKKFAKEWGLPQVAKRFPGSCTVNPIGKYNMMHGEHGWFASSEGDGGTSISSDIPGQVEGGGGGELLGTARWERPRDENIRQEYKVEYQNHFKPSYGDIFPTEQAFLDAVRDAPTVTVDKNFDHKIGNRSNSGSMSSLLNLISGYRSYPKYRNEGTLKSLEDRIKTGKPVDMPIVTKDGSSMRVLSGNTRMDIGFMHNPAVKVVLLDVGKYRKYNPYPRAEGGRFGEGSGATSETGDGTTSGGETTPKNYGLIPGDVAKFHGLKSQWAKVNNDLLAHIDHPDSPEAQAAMHEMERISKEIGQLHCDPGGPEGIGLPGGPRDVTIVGAGPGGLAASIFGGAEGLDTLIVEKNAEAGGQARYSSRIENFPGFPVGVTGETLTSNMFEQSARLGAENKLGVSVTGMTVDPVTGMKTLTMSDGTSVDSRTVILAGGVEFRQPDFDGADGPGVFVGDGKALSEASVGGTAIVLGGSNGAAQAALGAATKADQVYLISRSPISKGMSDYQVNALGNQPKVTVIENDNIASLNRDASGNPTSITTNSGQTISTKAVGVFTGSVPSTDWLPSGINRDKTGRVTTNAHLETSIPGVFAVGDMRGGAIGRIGVAVGEGQLALREANVFLDESKKAQAKLDVAIAHDDTHKSVSNKFNASDLLTRLFAVDRDNPWFGQTVEDVKPPVKKYNENHGEHGYFSSGPGGGGESGQYPVSSTGTLEGYTPQPAKNASELYARTYDASATPESVMAAVSPTVAGKAAAADAKIEAGTETCSAHQVNGKYTEERVALHEQILNEGGKGDWKGFTPAAVAAATPAAGEQPTLYILGGRGGSGKSWFSKSPDSPFDASKTMYINGDDMKESLPEYQGWNAALCHREAGDLTDMAHDRAMSVGLNVTFDATLRTTDWVEAMADKYRAAGYRVEGYYMHTAPQVSAVRAMARFDRTGRYVPAEYILGSTTNEATFDRMARNFDKWAVYDNNTDRGPVKVASKQGQ